MQNTVCTRSMSCWKNWRNLEDICKSELKRDERAAICMFAPQQLGLGQAQAESMELCLPCEWQEPKQSGAMSRDLEQKWRNWDLNAVGLLGDAWVARGS